ncbi:MAG: sigma-54-dependent transcriptional regulator [Desulfovibrio sp.]
MAEIPKVLVIDDEPAHRLMVRAVLEDSGWQVTEADCGENGLKHLAESYATAGRATMPHVVLVDMKMPGMNGLDVLREVTSRYDNLPVILLTAFGSVGAAVDAMKKGAFDYLTKPADNEELKAVLHKAYEFSKLIEENTRLRKETDNGKFQIIGHSAGMLEVKELISQAGPSEATVLILGDSGTGKELVAEGLHRASERSDKPLIKVNCAALPADLLESELFGYVKGAFTGAVKDKPGRFQLASGGTLFLDEIGEMPAALQAKLLRALQEKIVEPLGSVTPVATDVRIIAATNRNLMEEIQQGKFREDLYYRLSVLEIRIPPLKDRLDDLPLLTSFLLRKLGKKNHKEIRDVSPAFLDGLSKYHWPGNVRELENVLERALVLSRADTLTPDLLPAQVSQAQSPQNSGVHYSPSHTPLGGSTQPAQSAHQGTGQDFSFHSGSIPAAPPVPPAPSLENAEKEALVQALEANNGHRERTADALGISRRTLQYKLKKYGLTRRS